jgi:hypothetical protein
VKQTGRPATTDTFCGEADRFSLCDARGFAPGKCKFIFKKKRLNHISKINTIIFKILKIRYIFKII